MDAEAAVVKSNTDTESGSTDVNHHDDIESGANVHHHSEDVEGAGGQGGGDKRQSSLTQILKNSVLAYLEKFKTIEGKGAPPVPPLHHGFVSLLQAVISISLLAYMDIGMGDANSNDYMFLVASFGASAVLVHSAIASPLAQPRNVIIGHGVSAFCGVTAYKIAGNVPYFSCGLAVGLAIFFMERTNSVHPPGGATALVAVIGSSKVHDAGYLYVVFPCMIGATIMVAVSMICNNLDPNRKYPLYYRANWPLGDRFAKASQCKWFSQRRFSCFTQRQFERELELDNIAISSRADHPHHHRHHHHHHHHSSHSHHDKAGATRAAATASPSDSPQGSI